MALLANGAAGAALAQAPAPSPSSVTRAEPASKEELAGIAARGRLLTEYDRASWQGSDAVAKFVSALAPGSLYVADKVKDKWIVSFGYISPEGDQFVVILEATQKDKNSFKGAKLDKPRPESGRLLSMAKAIATCRAQFKGEQRPYNAAVLPEPSGRWWVYVMPAQTDSGVYPLGGDVRYQVSADGGTILETRQLHVVVNDFKGAPLLQGTPAMMVHTAVLDDLPEDTDVFFAMTYKPAVLQVIMTKNFVYGLQSTGDVRFMMKTADFIKKKP
jgi:hypothetical protein